MRDVETTLQQFGEFLLGAQLVSERATPWCVRWVRQFLSRPAPTDPTADQIRLFCEELERSGRCADWQLLQAEQDQND